jgi:hypothetical protein
VLVAEVTGLDAAEQAVTVQLPVLAGDEAGAHLADAALDSPLAARNGASVAYRDVEGARQEYRVNLALPTPLTSVAITLTWQGNSSTGLFGPVPPITVQAATLVDERTGMFTPLLPSDQGRFALVHSGDVKIYENLQVLPRAYLVHQTVATEADQAVAQVAARAFDPREQAIVEGGAALQSRASAGDGARIVTYAPERVVIEATSAEPAFLVLADSDDPGWRATVDDAPVPIYRTNVLVRGVELPAGTHRVEFIYQPAAWQRGLWLGVLGWLMVIGLLVIARPVH